MGIRASARRTNRHSRLESKKPISPTPRELPQVVGTSRNRLPATAAFPRGLPDLSLTAPPRIGEMQHAPCFCLQYPLTRGTCLVSHPEIFPTQCAYSRPSCASNPPPCARRPRAAPVAPVVLPRTSPPLRRLAWQTSSRYPSPQSRLLRSAAASFPLNIHTRSIVAR